MDENEIAATLMIAIDAATEPAKMSKPDALKVLEALKSELDARIEALEIELDPS